MGFPIVGKFFPADSSLVDHILASPLRIWKPDFVVLHNTSSPSLAQRPNGFTSQHMLNLADYYAGLGWHAGPHWFVDDKGCWAFSPLDLPGVHSPSWNHESWGVEQLGEYDVEAYDSGRGAAVRDNAVFLLAVLHHKIGADSATLRFHKQDPATTHRDCPGAHCCQPDVIGRVHDKIVELSGQGLLKA